MTLLQNSRSRCFFLLMPEQQLIVYLQLFFMENFETASAFEINYILLLSHLSCRPIVRHAITTTKIHQTYICHCKSASQPNYIDHYYYAVFVVTGCNVGLGYHAVKTLANRKAGLVVLACRNVDAAKVGKG